MSLSVFRLTHPILHSPEASLPLHTCIISTTFHWHFSFALKQAELGKFRLKRQGCLGMLFPNPPKAVSSSLGTFAFPVLVFYRALVLLREVNSRRQLKLTPRAIYTIRKPLGDAGKYIL